MVVCAVLLLAVIFVADAAVPVSPASDKTTVGSLKLASADCAGTVAFSATNGSPVDGRIILKETLVNKGVGYVAQTGIFTTQCPGFYQFSFAGYGNDIQLTLKKKLKKSDRWNPIAEVGQNGGSNLVLQEIDIGDQIAVFLDYGKPTRGVTFSGYRLAKK